MEILHNKVTRRIALGSIGGCLAAAAVGVRWLRPRPVPVLHQTDLGEREYDAAVSQIVEERTAWSRFRGVSGRADISAVRADAGKKTKITGDLLVEHVVLTEPNERGRLWEPKMTISNRKQDWSVSADRHLTKVACRDAELAGRLRGIDFSLLLECLALPKMILGSLYADQLNPRGTMTLEQVLRREGPWRNPSVPNSFIVNCAGRKYNEMEFREGHFAGWHKKGAGSEPEVITSLQMQIQSNGLWYPTRIECARQRVEEYCVRLANVVVTMASRA